MSFDPVEYLDDRSNTIPRDCATIPKSHWLVVNEHGCSFQPSHFLEAVLNLIKNPNITSSHLFRADILYDSQSSDFTDTETSSNVLSDCKPWYTDEYRSLDRFRTKRCIVRRLIPRNPELDRPVAQTCLVLERTEGSQIEEIIVILLPHVTRRSDLPWYHPAVQALAYWYKVCEDENTQEPNSPEHYTGTISIHFQLFPDQTLPLDKRLLRTAHNLLRTLCKHGEGKVTGYQKQGQHDQIVSQKRVQDTYSELKAKHAKRLSSVWVEKTEPSKHIFEDLGIAAYLIELWKDMYAPPGKSSAKAKSSLPKFPGFIDIGCGNGVLTEVLILSGYHGEGYDARRRKTWSVLSSKAQPHLHEMLCVPQPLFDLYPALPTRSKSSFLARARTLFHGSVQVSESSLAPPSHPWHNGLPAPSTFIISNHADELTPWTPLLACLNASPFLAIPCCSHNLSGARFRAPTAFNAYSADAAAPGYFAAQKKPAAKSIPITIPYQQEEDDHDDDNAERSEEPHASGAHASSPGTKKGPETGNLRALAPANRAKQPSAYASLCDWVAHIAQTAGYVLERDMLRIPSTRNIGLVGRSWAAEPLMEMDAEATRSTLPIAGYVDSPAAQAARKERVRGIVMAEGADGVAWVRRCEEVLAKGGGVVHGRE